jgi:hypothetical protein
LRSRLAAGFLLLGSFLAPALRAGEDWTVKGKVLVKHVMEHSAFKGKTSALTGIKFKVSARERILGKWGPWNSWGTDVTKKDGDFELKKNKDKSDRQFMVEVMFESDALELRHENASTSLDKVHWYTVYKSEKIWDAGSVSVGELVFDKGGSEDLNEWQARWHAEIWVLARKAMDYLAGLGKDFAYQKQVVIKYPVDAKLSGSYSNPINNNIYILRSDYNVETLWHEMMHMWAYQHCTGEDVLAKELAGEWLLRKGASTHDPWEKECIAFHEGFAEFGMEQLKQALITDDAPLPLNRAQLGKLKMTDLSTLRHRDYGWTNILRVLVTPRLQDYTFFTLDDKTQQSSISKVTPGGKGCKSPSLTFKNILSIFLPMPSNGSPDVISTKKEMELDAFLDRASRFLAGFTKADAAAIRRLIDPEERVQPADLFCK